MKNTKASTDANDSVTIDAEVEEIIVIKTEDGEQVESDLREVPPHSDGKKTPPSTYFENALRESQNLRNEIKDLHDGKKTEISKVLSEIKGDVISIHQEESNTNAGESSESSKVPKSQTHLTDSYYIQQRKKFVKTTHRCADQNLIGSDSNLWHSSKRHRDFRSPLDVAIFFQRRIISPFCTICHGLLAGVATLQLVLAYYLTDGLHDNPNSSDIFFMVYQRIALVGPSYFAFFLSICFVSILDRVDFFHIAKSDPRDLVSYRRSWIIGLLYFGGLLMNAVCFRYDHMILHYPFENHALVDLQAATHSPVSVSDRHHDHTFSTFLPTWKILNAVRCICSIVGWILFSFAQPEDLLADHLQEVKSFELEVEAISAIENRPI